MRILHTVEFYYPSIGGAQEVVRHLSERLVRLGHDVTVATTKLSDRQSKVHNGVKIIEFDISGNKVNGFKGEVNKYKKFLEESNFDIIMNYAAQQWTADIFFDVIDKVKAKKIFVPCGYSALYDPAYEKYFEKMPEILKKYDSSVYLSNDYRDINFARDNKIKNICVIPNGADETEFSIKLNEEQKKRIKNKHGLGGLIIMTIGNYTGEKGHLELLDVFKKLPVSKSTLVSAGTLKPHDGCFDIFEQQAWSINQSRKLIGKRVVMLDGENRTEVREALKCADIFVFFSNIECSPLVLFESAAAGVPFIASSAGNNKEIADWTKSGIIVKSHPKPNGRVKVDIKDALWQLTKLAHSKKRRILLGKNGYSKWKESYTWDKLTKDYLKLYQEVINSK